VSDFDTNHVWRKLCAGQAKISRSIDESLRRSGCVPLEWVGILFDIQRYGNGRIRLGELAERSSLSRSGITRLIDRMVEGGVISREACEHDGRGTYAVISELGKTKLTAALQVQERVLQAAFYRRFTNGDMEAFVRIAGALEGADS